MQLERNEASKNNALNTLHAAGFLQFSTGLLLYADDSVRGDHRASSVLFHGRIKSLRITVYQRSHICLTWLIFRD